MTAGTALAADPRVVLTLDAGGTNFSFSAIRGGQPIGDSVTLPAEPHDLEASLRNMVAGFQSLIDQVGAASYAGGTTDRLIQDAYDLGNPAQRSEFLRGGARAVAVPHSSRTVVADPGKRVGVGISKLGASRAVGIGAYAFALDRL